MNYGHGIQGNAAQMARQGAMVGAAAGYSDDAAKRMAELPAAIDLMERNLVFLQDALINLDGRLEGVMRPQGPEPAMPNEQVRPVPPMSGYASTVYAQALRLAILSERMQDLLRRLEV